MLLTAVFFFKQEPKVSGLLQAINIYFMLFTTLFPSQQFKEVSVPFKHSCIPFKVQTACESHISVHVYYVC